jgi:cytochrome P450
LLIGHAALGEETEFLQKRVKDLRAAFDTVIYKGFLREQLSEDENYQKAVDLMEEFSKEVFARREVTDNQAKCPHLASLKAAGNSNENDKLADIRGNPGSLISIITQKDKKTGNSVLPAKKQRDELLSFIFAGHETTGNSMSFAVWEIAKNPAIQSKLQLEIDSMLASVKSKTGKDFPDFPDFFRLPYLNLIINETLRLWPVVPGGTRRILTEDEIIAGVKVPQGTPLAFPHYTMHRDPTIWEDPEVFNPERKWHAEAFLPFTKQPRNCLGMNLALLEMRVVLFTLFAHFKVSLAHPNEVLEAIELATLRPKNGVWVFLEERRK